ncbi:MAG: hypothetical protein IPF95_16505 [Flavobacteriales bacterium]|nr:hypothetical protein [Flavobacteriales bacterium]MBK6945607.1 hypothetical protein [Flavobacteriales bacterium]MBK9534841.1 hypothetical protein [Flavobacteriales bacterium]MBP9137687.1 hypothetical protein [Flavobacteriales bacterium]HQV53735.1 hypothetical protein [Flavobacteriales bacterium]
MGFGMLAVLSNFTALNYFLPSLLILFAYTLFSEKRITSLRILIYSVITGMFFYFIIPVILELKNQGELYFGGRTSFYNDTLLSLSRTFAYHFLSIPLANSVFSLLFFVALLFSIITIFRAIQQKSFSIKIILPILFLLSILSPVAQHLFLETSFPTERTALLYYPILILVVLNGADGASEWIEKRLLELLACSFLIHLFLTANTTHCNSWRFDSGSKEVIGFLKEEYDQKGSYEPVSLGIDYLNIQSISYYKSAASFIDLSHHEVVKCWEYDMHLEELDPMYYGTTIVRKDKLSPEDAEKIVSAHLDHYYLNDFVVNELIRLGHSLKVEKHFVLAGSSLIKFN